MPSRCRGSSPTCTRRGPSTWPTTSCPPGVRRSGGSPRSSACAACTARPCSRPSTTSCAWNTPGGRPRRVVDGAEARALRGISGLVPNSRYAARVLAEVPSTLLVDVPADAEIAEPILVELHGADAANTEAGHVALRFGAHSRAIVVLNHTGSASLAQVVEVLVGDGAHVTVVSIQDWADDAVHLTTTEARVGRDASYKHAAISFGGDVVRMDTNVTYAGPGGSARPARPLLRRRRPAHRAPALRRPHRPAHPQQRLLQGRAAGPGRAHRLGRQRADPQGRRGHRDLRGEPQPGAHRRLPGRLDPQPGDRDRRDRGRRPRLGDRPLRRQPAVLPALARHRGGRGPPAGRARLLQRPDPQGRRAGHRGAAGQRRSRPSWPRT